MNENYKIAAFVLPIWNGEFYLGQRGTEPHKGLYGAIGGKSDPLFNEYPGDRYVGFTSIDDSLEPFHSGYTFPSGINTITHYLFNESIGITAIREFNEEIFSKEKHGYKHDSKRISNLQRIGHIVDESNNKTFLCYFFTCDLTTDNFSLSPREIPNFKPLSEINNSEIFPITKIALEQIRFIYKIGEKTNYQFDFNRFTKGGFISSAKKLKPQKLEVLKETNMLGAINAYSNQGITPIFPPLTEGYFYEQVLEQRIPEDDPEILSVFKKLNIPYQGWKFK